jgi:hypothetical protein
MFHGYPLLFPEFTVSPAAINIRTPDSPTSGGRAEGGRRGKPPEILPGFAILKKYRQKLGKNL